MTAPVLPRVERLERIDVAMIDALIVIAEDCAPQEACGLISVRGGDAVRLFVCENVAEDPEVGYSISRARQAWVLDKIEWAGDALGAIWHSHPDAWAYPSATDVRLASYPGVAHLIVGLRSLPHVRAWWLDREAGFGEVPLEIVGGEE